MISSQELLSKFKNVREIGRGKWIVSCPCPHHGKGEGDSHPSLSITLADKWLLNCHAGCDYKDIIRAIDVDEKELYPYSYEPSGAEPKEGDIVYNYVDLEGFYLYTKIRMHGVKGHKFRLATHKNGWVKGKPDGVYGVYAPQGIDAIKHSQTVCITEGEKDCDSVISQGLICFAYGSSTDWREEFTELCDFKDVVIFRDNDIVGEKVAQRIADCCEGRSKSVTIINPCPDIAGGDISDYLERGNDIYRLIADSRAGTYRNNDIDVILCDLFRDDKFKSLDARQQMDLLVMRYVVPTMGERDNKLAPSEFYFNRAWLRDMGIYEASNSKGRANDIQALKDAGYIKEIYGKKQKQGNNIYTLCKST